MDSTNSPIILAIHPTLPSVLSPGMQLLDWDLGWMKRQIFWGGIVRTVAFNPGDHNRYAGLSENCEVQVCLAGFLLFTNYKLWRYPKIVSTTRPQVLLVYICLMMFRFGSLIPRSMNILCVGIRRKWSALTLSGVEINIFWSVAQRIALPRYTVDALHLMLDGEAGMICFLQIPQQYYFLADTSSVPNYKTFWMLIIWDGGSQTSLYSTNLIKKNINIHNTPLSGLTSTLLFRVKLWS